MEDEEDVEEATVSTKPKKNKAAVVEPEQDGTRKSKRKSRKPVVEEDCDAMEDWDEEDLIEDYRPIRPKGKKKSMNPDDMVEGEDVGAKPRKGKKAVDQHEDMPNHDDMATDVADSKGKRRKKKEPAAVEDEEDVEEAAVPTKPKKNKAAVVEPEQDGTRKSKGKSRKPVVEEECNAMEDWDEEDLIEDYRPIRPKGKKKYMNPDDMVEGEDVGAKPRKGKKAVDQQQDSMEYAEGALRGGGGKTKKDHSREESSEESGEEELHDEAPRRAKLQKLTRAGPILIPNCEEDASQEEDESMEAVFKKPAGRGRGRGRGRGAPKAKAKAKEKAKSKSKAKKDTQDDDMDKPKRGRPPAKCNAEASTFARRGRPATAPASARWDAIVSVFRTFIKPEIKKRGIPVYCWEERVLLQISGLLCTSI